jgi:hypothetical protein
MQRVDERPVEVGWCILNIMSELSASSNKVAHAPASAWKGGFIVKSGLGAAGSRRKCSSSV